MSSISLNEVSKTYRKDGEARKIIDAVSLDIADGEFVVFVGPSGCGKSTMLRMIAGLEEVTAGDLLFGGSRVNDLSPSERGVGMVFQSYALYPHMTVRQNIAFPLKMAGVRGQEQSQAVDEVGELLEITRLMDLKPSQLSGGQRQRVAIGRALVRNPQVFLLDEPLSNLDAALRVRMRLNLAEYHQRLGCTVIYVTHDQVEATTLADKVVVLNGGHIEQVGSPMELYHFPRTRFVAEFIGSPQMNMIPVDFESTYEEGAIVSVSGHSLKVQAEVSGLDIQPGSRMYLGVRPENMSVGADDGIPMFAVDQEFMGAESIVYAKLEGLDENLLVRCPGTLTVDIGRSVRVGIPEAACHLFEEDGTAVQRGVGLEQLLTSPPPL